MSYCYKRERATWFADEHEALTPNPRFRSDRTDSRAHSDLILDRLHAVHATRNVLGRAALDAALGKARQHDGAIERFDLDTGSINLFVFDEARLDAGGEGGVINVGASGFLATGDCAAGCSESNDGRHGGDESGADV